MDGDGIYSRSFANIPPGTYEFKIALDENWLVSYPADVVPFVVLPGDNEPVIITFNSRTLEVTVNKQAVSAPVPVMETWAIIILHLLLFVLGVVAVRRAKTYQSIA